MKTLTPEQATKVIKIGHTPDMDDAFMFYAMVKRLIPMNGFAVEHVIEDIQALNRRAFTLDLDVTAISAANYPALAKDYWIMSVGSSVGQDYGPLLITKTVASLESLSGARIAIPGLQTTASLLLKLAIPDHQPVEMRFEQIPEAVLKGEVDAGLVIHEWQLVYKDAGLHPVLDLGHWWQEETKLPIPLGLNVVKRSLGQKTAGRVTRLLYNSILFGFEHQKDALAYAMQYGRGTDEKRSKQFVEMYVNDDTMGLSQPCREALRVLLKRAKEAGVIPNVPKLEIIEPAKD